MAGEPPPLRILFLITDLGKGGAERFLIDLATVLQNRRDVELAIGSLYDINLYRPLTDALPIEQLSFQSFSLRGHSTCPAYTSLLDRFRPDVVHTHRFLAEFLSSYDISADVAYVCHGHDNMVELARPSLRTLASRRAFLNAVERRHLMRNKYRRVPTTFVANSSHTYEYFRRVLPRRMKDDVVLIPVGFNYSNFRTAARRPPSDGARLHLINVGSFQEKKNQIFSVAIGQELRRRGIDFEITLLGDGENRALVENAVHAAGLGDRIVLPGNVSDVYTWLRRNHIYVHTARYEPFGLAILEAMAAGLPCIALDGLGNRDIVEDDRNGFLIGREDASAFADRIVALATDETRYLAMSRFAQQFAEQYDIAAIAPRFLDLYRSLAETAARRGQRSR